MWKRERTCTSPDFGSIFSTTTFETTWFVPHSGCCDQACGCVTRFIRTVIMSRSSAKIDGAPSQVV